MSEQSKPLQDQNNNSAGVSRVSRGIIIGITAVFFAMASAGMYLSTQVRTDIARAVTSPEPGMTQEVLRLAPTMTFRTLDSLDSKTLTQMREPLLFLTFAYAFQALAAFAALVAIIKDSFPAYTVCGGAGAVVSFLFVAFVMGFIGGGWFNVANLVVLVILGIVILMYLSAWKRRLIGRQGGSYSNTGDVWFFCLVW